MRVYVLLFNARTENEGIHTVQVGSQNKVLMFESEDDATRYALLLEAQDFPSPTVEAVDSEEIEEFCREANYESELIKDGMLAIPPDQNVVSPDWTEEGEPMEVESESEMTESELDRIRRQLEGLV
ncbi:DUF3110 domain-containing protein [Chroococcus sp. FPU101]|uniref:DUF3110 domain-containing protein n=1 Tax=Chroococcus sp. FPU101 TaxID=1974212 RepID=UPI001A8FC107|nr:DUF3110 domain-containing protein [Chroococcus sp. FPU101]GFE67934.1 hypothetical protein CFPU101_05440 [Chroococcus sp. FPU101]